MASADSPDHFFSDMEVLSANTSSAAGDNLQPPPYADDSILICSPPETPSSPASAAADASSGGRMGPGTEATQDPPSQKSLAEEPCCLASCNFTQNLSARKKRSVVLRRRLRGAKIISSDSVEEKQDDVLGIERLENENGNPSITPEAPMGGGIGEECDNSAAKVAPLVQQQRPSLLDVAKMMSGKADKRFEDTDILEIAVMKGIEFPPPRWWKPEGYGVQKPEDLKQG